MKIAIFHNLPSGGAKRSLHEFMHQMEPRHHLDVYSYSSANHVFSDIRPFSKNYFIYDFAPSHLYKPPFGRLNQAMRLLDLIRLRLLSRKVGQVIDKNQYDVVFVEPCQFESTPSILRYLKKTPSVYYCQEPLRVLYEVMPARPYYEQASKKQIILNQLDPLRALYYSVLKKSDFNNIKFADLVLVNSKFIQDAVKRIYKIDSRVNYNGVDEHLFRPQDGREKQKFFISVGSLTALKGFDFLIDSLANLPEHFRFPLKIVSNFQYPPEKKYLLELAKTRGVEIKLLENISDEKLVGMYNEASLTLYAPVREPFGLVPLETMACGTPIITVQEGGIPESVLNNQVGILVNRDPHEFSQAVEFMLQRPDLCLEYGQKGRIHILKNWTMERMISNLENSLVGCANGEKTKKRGL